jgi:elongation factor P hydroxylase
MYSASDLISLFEHCFFDEYHTVLVGGAEEPVYLPSADNSPHRIVFTRDYFASALHEAAHWCVAGAARRRLPDYGYWYAPDGRNAGQQAEFERLEAKPQALEWIFSTACGAGFRVSADNLYSGFGASDQFKHQIAQQARIYCTRMPERPARFIKAMVDFYGVKEALAPALYEAERLA